MGQNIGEASILSAKMLRCRLLPGSDLATEALDFVPFMQVLVDDGRDFMLHGEVQTHRNREDLLLVSAGHHVEQPPRTSRSQYLKALEESRGACN